MVLHGVVMKHHDAMTIIIIVMLFITSYCGVCVNPIYSVHAVVPLVLNSIYLGLRKFLSRM